MQQEKEKLPKVAGWLEEIEDAQAREKEWRKFASELVSLYECSDREQHPFNILFSNTETLAPALYNNLPRPVVDRRFKDANPAAKVAATVVQRALAFLLDNDNDAGVPFDDLMQQSVLEALVPGRGQVRFEYEATFTGEGGQVSSETIIGKQVPWDRFHHGYAKHWKDVPWVAFEHFMTREELIQHFDGAGRSLPLTATAKEAETPLESERDSVRDDGASSLTLGQVFEIWDKSSREVLFISPASPDKALKIVPDPLDLTGFFNCPRPLSFFDKIKCLVPVPLYASYEAQARELNTITVRINRIVKALKVRGFYDSTVEGLDRLLTADDNTLLPAENVAALQQGQTLEKAIWLMPLEKLIAVLQQLYVQREQVKQVIYEITGISDILRGASVASETATAQNIKNQWGTLRLKRMQKRVSVYVRDCLRIMAEIACTKLSAQTLGEMTGVSLPTAGQKQQAQALQAQLQQAQAAGQPLPPAMTGQLRQLQIILSSPTLEEVEALLRSDLRRGFQIDVETNSTVDAEATEDKQNIGEFLNALAQYFNGIAPMIQSNTLPFEAAKEILLAVVRRYRFGTEVEDRISEMQPPPQPQMPPEVQKAQQEVAKAQEKVKEAEMELEASRKEFEMEKAFAAKELDFAKKMALREVEQVAKAKETDLGLRLRDMEHSIGQKAADLQSRESEVEGKAAEVEKGAAESEASISSAAHAAATEALQANREDFTKLFTQALSEILQKPRRARKLPDGTWETF